MRPAHGYEVPRPQQPRSNRSFRRSTVPGYFLRSSSPFAARKISAPSVNEVIMDRVPKAKVIHVCSNEELQACSMTSSEHSSSLAHDETMFLIVEDDSTYIRLAIRILKERRTTLRGVVIVVLMAEPALLGGPHVTQIASLMIKHGADDAITLLADEIHLSASTSESYAKAHASKQAKLSLERQVRADDKQCDSIFWQIAHDVVEGIPPLRPRMTEVHDESVADVRFGRQLGKGRYGKVYMWQNPRTQQIAAVNVILKSSISCFTQVVKLATECEVLRRLSHPNVVGASKVLHGKQSLYVFMEMAGKTNLWRILHLEGDRGLPWETLQPLLLQISRGVAHCHAHQIAHCDLKPENIVVGDDGCPKLVDFGEAVDLTHEVVPLDSPRGTLLFMAPEIMYRSPWDPIVADLWALGGGFLRDALRTQCAHPPLEMARSRLGP